MENGRGIFSQLWAVISKQCNVFSVELSWSFHVPGELVILQCPLKKDDGFIFWQFLLRLEEVSQDKQLAGLWMNFEGVFILLIWIVLGANCCSLASLWYSLGVNCNGGLSALCFPLHWLYSFEDADPLQILTFQFSLTILTEFC